MVVPFVHRSTQNRLPNKLYEPSREAMLEWLNERWGGDLFPVTKAEYFGKTPLITKNR